MGEQNVPPFGTVTTEKTKDMGGQIPGTESDPLATPIAAPEPAPSYQNVYRDQVPVPAQS